ncbi:TonB-dependent receptor [Caulobacter sp.]|uniref:TonB-dependent receptor domain-containing protein n=1 Tax=Caulobacter sp. TaxID=78 RepID=UPI001B2C829E|nr:TonB-dependent receptor [Caulobacter sp.]MBO9543653.1 TonB-dependent receptor [Caulobacter sp.]
MISRSVLLGTSMLIALASAGAAFAQAEQASAPKEDTAELEAVVVTGSRIRRPDLVSAQPIQVLSSESIDSKGYTNVADALNDMPSAGVPINPIGDQGSFGTGRNYINLFNLGTNRTLTLVNGRRFVGSNVASLFSGAGGGGQVDFNAIPTGLIDRIETIQAGGAAVYGSDAIAGVINVITKTHFEGVEIDGQYGVSDRNDADVYRGRITAGRNFMDGRLNLSGSYEYNETTQLGFNDRPITARQLAFVVNPANRTTTDGIPGSIIALNRRIPEVTLGGIAFRNNGSALSSLLTIADPSNPGQRVTAQFGPGGTLIPYNTGQFWSASVASGGDGMNLADLSSLISPVKRHVATFFARYDVTDHIRFNSEVFYNHQTSVEPYNQPIYNAPIFGGTSASLAFSTANPFLPAATRTALLGQPTPLTPDAANPGEGIFYLSRASADLGNNKTSTEGDLLRTVFNLEGDFEFADRKFFWNAAANFGKSWGSFSSPNIDQVKFNNAIDAVRDSSGAIVCRSAAARAEGCAPLNMFGLGAPSEAAKKYIGVQFVSDYALIQTGYEANFGGDLVKLPAGMVSFNAGYEYRKEKSRFQPNDPQRLGVGRSAAITALSGSYTTKEAYIEGLIPIFGGDFSFPGMRSLELEGARRRVDNSLAGKNDAWSYGIRWKPINDLLIRGTRSGAFRAPAITELFLPNAVSFMTATDPCDARNINSGPNPATRGANCRADFAALGLPTNFNLTSNVQAATVQGTTSGNRGLRNELADEWSVGFVYQPSFIKGLAVSFDWVNVDITDAIVNFSLTSIMQVCYDSPSKPADVCSRFRRNSAGQIITADTTTGYTGPAAGFVNAGYTNFQGATLGVDYNFELTDIPFLAKSANGADLGGFGFNFDLFHVNKQETSVTGLGFDLNDDKGEIGNPDVSWRLDTTYKRGPLAVTLTTSFTGKSYFNKDFTPETRDPLWVKDYYLNDLAISYDLTDVVGGRLGLDRVKARLNVRNLFDEEAPWGTTGLGVYDVLGRYYQIGLNARF